MINKVSNIDTIYLLVDIYDYEETSFKILDFLKKEKEKAKRLLSNNSNYKHLVNINNISFELLPNGSKGYAYILHNSGYEIKISQFKSGIENFSPIQIRISSEYLWAKGLIYSWRIIQEWIEETFGEIEKNKISRVDICMHVSNIDFIKDYQNSYKGAFKKTGVTYTGDNINCLTFGTRKGKNIYCRIYNKTLEIKETKRKSWFTYIWQKNDLDIENVWNLEFELKSEFLREFNITTIQDLENSLKDIWTYCTKKWLVKVDKINTRIERCPINEEWQQIQHAYDNFLSKGIIKREKQIDMEADTLIPSIVGNITSYSARKNIISIDNAFGNLYKNTKKYLAIKNTTFENETKKKINLLKEGRCNSNE
ncbi:MAG: hypothetical protein KH434_02475 [Clostridium sp.]|nr:hypothetical protein [Clostridium sp.]